MRCRMAHSLFEEYLLGTLNPTTKAQLEEHLATCAACRDTLQQMRAKNDPVQGSRSQEPKSPQSAKAPVAEAEPDLKFSATPSIDAVTAVKNDSFIPQAYQETDLVRRRLETMGVLFPEPGSSSLADFIPLSNEAQTEELPLQQLMKRFTTSGEANTPLSEVRAAPALSLERATAFAPSPVARTSSELSGEAISSAKNVIDFSAASIAPVNITPVSTNISYTQAVEEIDKSDDLVWVDIVVTHHVTRKQLHKRVRRDSAEAERYFEENPDLVLQADSPAPSNLDNDGSKEMVFPWQGNFVAKETEVTASSLPESDESPDQPTERTEELENDALEAENNSDKLDKSDIDILEPNLVSVNLEYNSDLTATLSDIAMTTQLAQSGISSDPGSDDSDDLAINLPEYYEESPAAAHRHAPPTQINPVVQRPAEIGRERLAQQSRLARNEHQVIIRESASAALPAYTFARMRWMEKLRRSPLLLLAVVIVLIFGLVFLSGMVVSLMNSQTAQAKREYVQEINNNLQIITSNLRDNVTILEDRDISFSKDYPMIDLALLDAETPLGNQAMALSSLHSDVNIAVMEWQSEQALQHRAEDAEKFRLQMIETLRVLFVHLEKCRFPQNETEWQKTQSLIEPVATLALRYIRTGDSDLEPPPAELSEAEMQSRIEDLQAYTEERLEIVSSVRYYSSRKHCNRWVVRIKGVDWAVDEGYDITIEDTDGSLQNMVALGEQQGFYPIQSMESIESIASALAQRGAQYFLIGDTSDPQNGYHDYYLAPQRGLKVFPEEVFLLRLEESGRVKQACPLSGDFSSEGNENQEILQPVIDLFSAAYQARQYLDAEGAIVTSEATFIADMSHGLLGLPRLAWLYRGKVGDSWRMVIVDEDGVIPFDEFVPLIRQWSAVRQPE